MFTMSQAPIIETERLRLRGHQVDDLPQCAAMWAKETVTRFIGGKPLTTEGTWLRMLRHAGHWSLLGFGYWLVEEKSTRVMIGEAGLAEFRRDIVPSIVGTPEAGWVFSPVAHGKGYAFETAHAVLQWGERRFGNARSVCLIDPENLSSLRLAAKLGYIQETTTTFRGKPTLILGRR